MSQLSRKLKQLGDDRMILFYISNTSPHLRVLWDWSVDNK